MNSLKFVNPRSRIDIFSEIQEEQRNLFDQRMSIINELANERPTQLTVAYVNTLEEKMRGFNEESIFASTYAIFTAELKFQLDKSSAVFLFYDQAWYERNDNVYFSDTPFGFGAGALLGTANGSFSIFYALGSEQNNPILLRNGKIHFGFINRF